MVPTTDNTSNIWRVLRPAFCDFADWIFGPDGIHSLRLLVYGDLSRNGYYMKDVVMLRRKGAHEPPAEGETSRAWEGYLHNSPENRIPEIEELVAENMDFLTACPIRETGSA